MSKMLFVFIFSVIFQQFGDSCCDGFPCCCCNDENTQNITEKNKSFQPYMKWNGLYCSMCSLINALWTIDYIKNFFLNNETLPNLGHRNDILDKKVYYNYDLKINYIDDYKENYENNKNAFLFFKNIFTELNQNKIIESNKKLFDKFIQLTGGFTYDIISHYSLLRKMFLLNDIIYIREVQCPYGSFSDVYNYFSDCVKINMHNNELKNIIKNIKDIINYNYFKIINCGKYISEKIFKEKYKFYLESNPKFFTLTLKNEGYNVLKNIQLEQNIDLSNIFNCDELKKLNTNLNTKYTLKSIIVHCGENSVTEGDWGCFSFDKTDDKYFHFQMDEKNKKYTLEEINNMESICNYKKINIIMLFYEQI